MLLRALILALSCACTFALTPLSAAGDDNDCALYLSGPGRTSAYDYSLNLLRGNFGYEGQHTCITYEAVNQAYLDARKRILVAQPKGDWKAEDFASAGELVLDISISLARRYGLTYEEIEKGLPLIDTSRTLIREICPPVFSHVECRPGKYRRLDGLCNNLQNPTWGSTMAPFQRLIGPLFADGINAPRIAHTGHDLPLSRVVSRTMHPDDGFHDHAGTVMVIAWGQFMDHDYTLTGTPLDPRNRNDPEECCKRPPHLKHPYCNEIRIPDDDYFYRLFGVKCIDFVRGFPSPRPGCKLGSRVPFNTLTGVIDGNTVYGVTEKFARKLRTGYGGLLRMNPVFKEYGLKDLLPLKLDIPEEGCTRPNKNMYCFEAGEIRVNEQLVLTVMHTLMAREHNRVAEGLAAVNPHWDDETLYQEARRINIAEIQHITYNEFLPILLGKDVMEKFGLVLEKEGYWEGHDPNVNPDVIDAFAAAAYRFGHSLLPTAVERWSKAHKFIASKRLSDLIRRPYDLYRAGVLDEYVMGLMNQVAQAMDDSITQEVTNHLFKKVGARFGMDLVSFNMQRGREFGLPGYMEFRKFCGLSGANSFQDLFGAMPNETVRKYESIFEHPVDVDLWSGGVSERPLPGSMLGPTFACIIATQFSYSRRGDRFWYELPQQPSSFTPEQLKEVKKARLARVICDNTDIIDTVQLYPFVLPDHELNPRVPCRSGIIPSIDFSKWAEPPPFAGNAKQFVTYAQIQVKNETEACNNSMENVNITVCSPIQQPIPTEEKKDQKPVDDTNTHKTDESEPVADTDSVTEAVINATIAAGEKTVPKSDAIMKYVYNKNEKSDNKKKTTGHVKNSLKRKKRGLIVDYETSHDKQQINDPAPHLGNAQKYIKDADLADFNIETLHDDIRDANLDIKKTPSREVNPKPYPNIKKSPQVSYDSPENHSSSSKQNDNEDSEEYANIDGDKSASEEDNISQLDTSKNKENEGKDFNDRRTSIEYDADVSKEGYIDQVEKTDSKESTHTNIGDGKIDSNNKYSSEEYAGKSNYEKTQSSEEESDEKEPSKSNAQINNSAEKLNDDYKENDQSSSSDESSENKYREGSDDIRLHNKYELPIENDKPKLPVKIQDVDLGDFSHERIQLNENGEVESAKDNQENYEQQLSGEASLVAGPKSKQYKDSGSNMYPKVNGGEVKPVVEINNESAELSEEKDRDEHQRFRIDNDSKTLKTPLDYQKDKFSEEKVGKIENKYPEAQTHQNNAKEEFERIPLNYKHDKNSKKKASKASDDVSPTKINPIDLSENVYHDDEIPTKVYQSTRNTNANDDYETPTREYHNQQNEDVDDDALPPTTIRYDENLKIKFDDISIKLPEIQLPDDILAYNYEETPQKTKNKYIDSHEEHSGEDDDNENKNNISAKKQDKDHEHHKSYDDNFYVQKKPHEDYKRAPHDDEDEDHDVDLYEKFVRERFGKKESFEKRLENLQQQRYVPWNPQLSETIEKIFKKTEETNKEAIKSKDPNAGYMWTLEYGEN